MLVSRRTPSARDPESFAFSAPLRAFARPGWLFRAPERRPALAAAAWAALAIALLAAACPPARAAADPNMTKAEMLWNIAKFIQWPDGAGSGGQLVVTILGEDELAVTLAQVLSTKHLAGRPVFVRFARRAQDARGSQILYVAGSESAHMDQVLAEVAGAPVLTVADTPAFAAHGGMVGFTTNTQRVRFEINLGHAERSGLHISAKLLALARVVDSGP